MNEKIDSESRPRAGGGVTLDPARLDVVLELWRAAGKRTVLPVAGSSMLPFIRPGWNLVLDHSPARHPFGAVIVFLRGRMLVAHRVVGHRRRGGYVTKGDAILHLDRGVVADAHVVGRVVAVQRDGREQAVPAGSGGRAVVVAALSRMVAELNRVCRLLRWLSSPAGRLAGVVPGPTRLLRALNRVMMGGAARAVGREGSANDEAAGPRD